MFTAESASGEQTIHLLVRPLFDKFVDSLVDHTDDQCVVDTNNEISFNFVAN